MRWGLRREPRGRHGLGAAVTAIPAAPVRPAEVPVLADQPWSERFPDAAFDPQPVAVVPAPVPTAPVVALPPEPSAAPPAEPVATPVPTHVPHVPLSLDLEPGLLGPPREHLGSPDVPPPALPPPTPQAPAPVPVVPVQAVPVPPPPPVPVPLVPVVAQPGLAVEQLAAAPAPAVPRPSLPVDAVPAQPVLPAEPASAAPAGPRVEIGFADGSFRMLDPASSAAQALSELVAELTSKDPGRGATGS